MSGYPVQRVTANEARIIAIAAAEGEGSVEVPFRAADGTETTITMCGLCGRMVCFPGCPTSYSADEEARS